MEAAAVRAGATVAAPAAKGLYRWWRPKTDRTSVAGHADDLAESVAQAERQLQQELRAGQGSFMHVGFTALTHSRSEEGIDAAEVDEIATYFALLDQPRRLVVLGEPGAGKTVTATYLVRGLLELRRDLTDARRAAEPVPVRINTAGWDGEQDFSAWLVVRLKLDYGLRPGVGKKMVERGLVLPVLDGLDEMDDDATAGKRARAFLDRLNRGDWADRPVVVLCRSIEFDDLKQHGGDNGLHGGTILTLTPLSSEQAKDYLIRYQDRIGATDPAWERVITHLAEHADSPIVEVLESPWMLGLAATTLRYTPRTATTLLDCPTPEAVREQLFAAQIPAALVGIGETDDFRDYTSDNVGRWLRSLARCLDHRRLDYTRKTGRNGVTIRVDEIWEIAGSLRVLGLHTLVVGLVYALTGGLTLVLMGNFAFLSALVFMLTFFFVLGINYHADASARRMTLSVPKRSRWGDGLVAVIAFGWVCVIGGVWAAFGFPIVLALALASGLIAGLETTAEDRLSIATDERRLIRDDLKAALITGGLFGLSVGLAAALTFGPMVGLAFGVTVGLTLGLTYGRVTGRHFIAVLIFKMTADFPARPVIFLVWARNSGLLRVNATAYQFRHQTYQQWILHPGPRS